MMKNRTKSHIANRRVEYRKVKPDHGTAILKIINNHFDQAEERIGDVYATYFVNLREVLGRYWRHKRDIPSDLLALPRHTWNLMAGKFFKKQVKPIPKSGKMKEVERIISDHLLDLKGLEKKIEDYAKPYQMEFEKEYTEILKQIPALKRKKFTEELKKHLEKLSIPIEGIREAVLFLVAGIVGKVFSEKVTFGSMMATGKAVAASIYISQLSWFGSLWASIFGIPAWVSYAGAGAGIIAGVVIAPLLQPFFEIGINRFRAKRVLKDIVNSARQKLTAKGRDSFNIAGKVAIYLQVLPDLAELTRTTAKTLTHL